MKTRKVSAEVTGQAGTHRPGTTVRHPTVTAPAVRHAMIAEAAYFLAEKRGFAGDLELEDWFAAEQLVDHASGKASARGKSNP